MPPKKGRDLSIDPRVKLAVTQETAAHRTVGEMVYDVIKRMFHDNVFAPGEWIRQESLAAAIGVSRIPVRNALVSLEGEGYVTLHPRRGARVTSLPKAELEEVYRIRCLLETYALRLSLPKLTEEKIGRLYALAAQLDDSESGDHLVLIRSEFYDLMYSGRENPVLVRQIEDLRKSVGKYLLLRQFGGHTHSRHTELVDSIAARDLLGAEAWIYAHLSDVAQSIQEFVDLSTNDRS